MHQGTCLSGRLGRFICRNYGKDRVSLEGQLLDQKSLRAVTGKTADWSEIAKDCVAFANATGGRLLLGIEDGRDMPPSDQQIPRDLPDTVRRKVAERTVNVAVAPQRASCSPIPRPEADGARGQWLR